MRMPVLNVLPCITIKNGENAKKSIKTRAEQYSCGQQVITSTQQIVTGAQHDSLAFIFLAKLAQTAHIAANFASVTQQHGGFRCETF